MARKIIWSDEAIADLATIVGYIAADKNPGSSVFVGLRTTTGGKLTAQFSLAALLL